MNTGEARTKIPVILDTDIGSDIDDSWALAMLLRSPELDTRLITTCTDNTPERAKLVAKMLEIEGRTDIPVGIGMKADDDPLPISPWVENYDLSSYRGTLHEDGVEAMIDCIMNSDEPIVIVAIGPLTNIAEALHRKPEIATRAKIVGMQGAVYRGYDGSNEVHVEYNIRRDVPAAQKVFTAGWNMVITPLDTCGIVRLEGGDYQQVLDCPDPLIESVIEQYRIWFSGEPDSRSSILFDTVAIYLAFADEFLEMKQIGIRVTDGGSTAPDENAKQVSCALSWKSLPGFEDFLVKRLVGTDTATRHLLGERATVQG